MTDTQPPKQEQEPEQWRNRIVDEAEEDPKTLLANPRNWRLHPESQQKVLLAVLKKVGFVQEVIVNRTTGFVLDGHLRVALAIQQAQASIPVKYIEVSPDEELELLTIYDAVAALAEINRVKLDELLKETQERVSDPAMLHALDQIAANAGLKPPTIQFKEYDESIADSVEYNECPACGHKWPR
jgi:ParB-like chromosome segregation protein Spo0J